MQIVDLSIYPLILLKKGIIIDFVDLQFISIYKQLLLTIDILMNMID